MTPTFLPQKRHDGRVGGGQNTPHSRRPTPLYTSMPPATKEGGSKRVVEHHKRSTSSFPHPLSFAYLATFLGAWCFAPVIPLIAAASSFRSYSASRMGIMDHLPATVLLGYYSYRFLNPGRLWEPALRMYVHERSERKRRLSGVSWRARSPAPPAHSAADSSFALASLDQVREGHAQP
jgi:hypothetical protein